MIKSLLLLGLLTVTLLAVSSLTSSTFVSEASSLQRGSREQYENYDIRLDHSPAALDKLRSFGGGLAGRNANARASIRGTKIEFNDDLEIAEIISPAEGSTSIATARTGARADTLKSFVLENQTVFGIGDTSQLVKIADYSNPDGNLSFAHFVQELNGIPVFAAEVKAGFSSTGDMFRVVNSLSPGLSAASASSDFGSPEVAVAFAGSHVGINVNATDVQSQKNGNLRFSVPMFSDVTAERFYFPVANGVVLPVWRVMLEMNDAAYYVVVDARGSLLWRTNLTAHQALPATFNVYGNNASFMKTADSPSPFSPGCLAPTGCPQPSIIPRTDITLIGNEAPYTFNNLGWIPDTGLAVRTPANPNITDGNNVETGIDRIAPNGVDENGWATGNPNRVFSYAYNPAPGDPAPGDEPLSPGPQPTPPTAFQQGAITHGFYLINRWHDEMYRLGFTEQAQNYQHFNFGRGGAEGDRISFEIQDGSGTNAANFTTPADGGRPRLQMFVWTNPTPDRDGALDSTMVTHEMTHGLSRRLHGNATGLNSNMSSGMGEGWSDFYAFALLSEPNDHPYGTHVLAGYVGYQILPGYDSNYYYGIRRFPVAIWASRGLNGLPHNPLTWRYVNSNCADLIGTTVSNPNSAYPRGPLGSANCDQVHNLGEIWAVTLWEVREQLMQRHGPSEGNRRVLQYVTDGMKLSPINPTVLNSRDAILAAAAASDSGDVGPMWRGFAIRGLGANASIQNVGTGSNNTAMTESFLLPIQFRRPPRADFDGDGRTDVSVFRPSDSVWYLNRSTTGFTAVTWGLATDKPVPDDFDGDGKTDVAVFRATADGAMPDYYILRSLDATVTYISWGTTGDIAVTEDYDGDNKADVAIYRPSTSQFWVRRSTDGTAFTSGPMPGTPLAGDWNGDGRAEFWTFNNGRWQITGSTGGFGFNVIGLLGIAGDKPVQADYDGDGRDDIAVYRPSNGTWYISTNGSGTRIVNFGLAADIPAPGDYDGDGKADIAVYRDGVWYINGSMSGVVISNFGLAGDAPLPASYLP